MCGSHDHPLVLQETAYLERLDVLDDQLGTKVVPVPISIKAGVSVGLLPRASKRGIFLAIIQDVPVCSSEMAVELIDTFRLLLPHTLKERQRLAPCRGR